jgi:hypothetical protein
MVATRTWHDATADAWRRLHGAGTGLAVYVPLLTRGESD